jgi:sugar phosphate isomerase/epimerase
MFSRRRFLSTTMAGAALMSACRTLGAEDGKRTIGLGFSLYGMKSLSLAEALKACAELGYDSVELPVMPDWPADSAKLSAEARREHLAQLDDLGLRLTSLMENLPALGDDAQQAANLDRLKRACELARDLKQGERVPLVETILGGKVGEFEAVKVRLAGRLKEWAKVAAEAKVTLAVKAHVSNATQRPQQLTWLLEKVASPYLKGVYDYSHFQLQELALAETLTVLLPQAVFIHVKDTEHAQGKRGFLLPGEGTIDYAEYFKLLAASSYRGDVVVEVSGQVFGKPGYEPLVAARKCYNHLAPAMRLAEIDRD